MVSVDQAYMVGHMKNADGSINNKNVVLSAACEAAELFQCMMSVNQKLEEAEQQLQNRTIQIAKAGSILILPEHFLYLLPHKYPAKIS